MSSVQDDALEGQVRASTAWVASAMEECWHSTEWETLQSKFELYLDVRISLSHSHLVQRLVADDIHDPLRRQILIDIVGPSYMEQTYPEAVNDPFIYHQFDIDSNTRQRMAHEHERRLRSALFAELAADGIEATAMYGELKTRVEAVMKSFVQSVQEAYVKADKSRRQYSSKNYEKNAAAAGIAGILEMQPSLLKKVRTRLFGHSIPPVLRSAVWRIALEAHIHETHFSSNLATESSPATAYIRHHVYDFYQTRLLDADALTQKTMLARRTATLSHLSHLYTHLKTFRPVWIEILELFYDCIITASPLDYGKWFSIWVENMQPPLAKCDSMAQRILQQLSIVDNAFNERFLLLDGILPVPQQNEESNQAMQRLPIASMKSMRQRNRNEFGLSWLSCRAFVIEWLSRAFVGIVSREVLVYIFDQCFTSSWDYLETIGLALLLALREAIESIDDYGSLREALLNTPKTLTVAPLQTSLAQLANNVTA